ncbi:hypothetical protein M6B38_368400 [Iris pallida]|uniref:Uncharacterized protein n=1 Tax=Iris pallida TaxID=29817 RepID=A0AAX6GGC9_IRIPA|nr:hypothetical protein M6B38_368400 [Iris pallida]
MVTRETLDYFLFLQTPTLQKPDNGACKIKKNKKRMSLTSPTTDSPSSAAKTRSEAKQRRRLRRRRLSHPGWRILSAVRWSSCVRAETRSGVHSLQSEGTTVEVACEGSSSTAAPRGGGDLIRGGALLEMVESGVDRSIRDDKMVARSSRRCGDAWLWPGKATGLRSRLERRRFLMAARRGGNRRRTPAIGDGSARGNSGMSLGCVSVVMGLVSELRKSVLY